jgi:hypothetical protein
MDDKETQLGRQLQLSQTLEPTGTALAQATTQLDRQGPSSAAKERAEPGIRAMLLMQDWAN